MNRIVYGTMAMSLLMLSVNAYIYPTPRTLNRPSFTPLSVIKRGRKGKDAVGGSGGNGMQPMSNNDNMGSQINWCPTLYKPSDLPQQDGSIAILDTNLPTLKNGATNPTGAVAVAKFGGDTYCFSISCPQCKIPVLKAKLLEGPPRLSCNFCQSTYDLKSGAKVEAAESGGMFGGIMKSLLSAKDGGPLPVYRLGEKGGKVLIAL
jgi:nitrite reductase/ring-hydroxylating ferredoxin subunit